ncbi:hypothetical protein M6B38_223445 [Iris pallida]|uniref:Uncharacterized protein n=1 Tax=Iris pallida TaxID=29817 RepID=A0AAX6DVY8_IRIPA|nr:hypothetical protein M6B38_223445 [Iris pallida]
MATCSRGARSLLTSSSSPSPMNPPANQGQGHHHQQTSQPPIHHSKQTHVIACVHVSTTITEITMSGPVYPCPIHLIPPCYSLQSIFSVVRQTKHPNQHQPRLTATIPCRQSRYHHPESAASLGATLHRDAFLEMPLLRVPNDFAESCAPCAVVSTYRSLR